VNIKSSTSVWNSPGGYAEIIRVSWPLVISMGSFTMMQFADRMFLAWYSAVSIQAALPAGILSFTIICGFMALAGYANSFVAQYFGTGDLAGCSRSTAQGVWMSIVSWPVMLAMMPLGRWILHIAGHAPEVQAEELIYFNILMIGSVATPLGAAISSFFTGQGDTRTNMYANIAGNLVNFVLAYAMIFGRWGCPEMGIRGAAWASVIAGFVGPAIMFAIYFSRRIDAKFATRSTFRIERRLMLRMARFGLPSAGHLLLDVSSFGLFVLFTGRLGSIALASSNMALAVNNIAFMPLIGMSIAASILVGQYQGRGDSVTAEKAGWTCLKVGWIYMAFIGSTFILFPRAYFELFSSRGADTIPLEQVLPLGRYLLMMMAAWGLMDTVNLVISGALKGAGDTRFVMYYSVAMAWGVWITGELVILFVLHRGIVAAWLWLTFYVIIMAAGFLWRYRSGRWKSIELLEKPPTLQPPHGGAEAMIVVD
jgi:multidrug resistance protein, MATE family